MSKLESYEHIGEFAQSVAKTDTVLEELNILTEQELADLNTSLDYVGANDPVAEWGSEIREGNITRATAEIFLMWHFRRVFGYDAVTLNAEYTNSGKDFDLLVEWDNKEYWIDVRTPEGAFGEMENTGGGWIAGDRTWASIANKLEQQFEKAREVLHEDAILVLAVYLKAGLVDQLSIGQQLHHLSQQDDFEHPGKFCDAFLEYMHHSGKTTIDVREFTTQGEQVTALKEELIQQA